MDSKVVGSWIAAGANFAVLAGLVLVAVQIRQNTASTRGAAYQTWVAAATEFNMGIATDPELAAALAQGHFDPGGLTATSQMQYAMSMLGLMHMVQASYYLNRDGSFDSDLWEMELQRAVAHLTFPGVRQWWDAGAKTQLSPDFVRMVESTSMSVGTWTWEAGKGYTALALPSGN